MPCSTMTLGWIALATVLPVANGEATIHSDIAR
jgi:hypothetical protein